MSNTQAVSDVKIEWICGRPLSRSKNKGRAEACEEIFRAAGRQYGWSVVGIRHIDHATTRVYNEEGELITIPTDPHITVYVGHESPVKSKKIGEGHLYITYAANGLPERLARLYELRIVTDGRNPEIWARDTTSQTRSA